MKQNRNIGGSILPSNSPEILQPIECFFGTLQVTPNEERDTHELILFADHPRLIASHPNGYTCHCLATYLRHEGFEKVKEQVNYILDCGGLSMKAEKILDLIAYLSK